MAGELQSWKKRQIAPPSRAATAGLSGSRTRLHGARRGGSASAENARDAIHSARTGAAAGSAAGRTSQTSTPPAARRSRESIPDRRPRSPCGATRASASAAVSHSSSLRLVTNTRSIERTIASIESSAWCSRKIRLNSAIAWPLAKCRARSRCTHAVQRAPSAAARAAARTEESRVDRQIEHQRRPRPVQYAGASRQHRASRPAAAAAGPARAGCGADCRESSIARSAKSGWESGRR